MPDVGLTVVGGAEAHYLRVALVGGPPADCRAGNGSTHILSRRVGHEGQGMDLALEFGRQRVVDQAMARQPRFAGK